MENEILLKSVLYIHEEKPKHARTLRFGSLFGKWTPRFFVWDFRGGITHWKNEQQYLLDQGQPFTIPTQDLVVEMTETTPEEKDRDRQFCFRIGNNRLKVKAATSQICQEWLEAFEKYKRMASDAKNEWEHEHSHMDRYEYSTADTEFKDFFTAQSGINPWDRCPTPLLQRVGRHSLMEVPRTPCEFTKGPFQSLLDFVLTSTELPMVLVLNHVLFTSSRELFQSLVDRYFVTDSSRGQKQAILNFINTWMERFIEDLEGILPEVEGFFMLRMRPPNESGIPDVSARAIRASNDLKSLEERKRALKVLFDRKRRNPPKPYSGPAGPTLNFLKKFVPESADICDFAARKVAEQLLKVDFDNFKKVKPRELLNKAWTRESGTNPSNMQHMIRVFNCRSYWVASQIIGRRTKQQTRCIWHFINVCQECRALNNFYAAYAILNGLTLTPIHRLQKSWKALPSSCKQTFTQLKGDLDTSRNFIAYRNAFNKATGIKIPHLAVVCKDLFQLEEIDTMKEGVINWTKLMDCWEIMKKSFFEPQGEPPVQLNWSPYPELEMAIHAGLVRVLTEEEIWAESYKCLPKAAPTT